MKKIIWIFVVVLAVAGAGPVTSQAQVVDPELQQLLDTLAPEETVKVLVQFSERIDLKTFQRQSRGQVKGQLRRALITALKDQSAKSRKGVMAFLKGKAIQVAPLWITNGLAVTASKAVIEALAAQPGIDSIRLDGQILTSDAAAYSSAYTGAPEWNLDAIGAPQLWNLGHTGSGRVVALMDTGVDANHDDLAPRWRGGSNSWFDPNGEHATPYDGDGHGTRTLGVMVGGDATGTAIGVAPGARWIAVKMFNDAGAAAYSVIHLGFQWLLDPDGDATTDDAPDVVNNSWGYGQQANTCFTEFQPDIQVLKAADIAVVFAAGNGGPYPSTSESPANYPESFAVGAIDDTGTVHASSSRGPSVCDGTVYPEVVAPGVGVKTTDLTFGGVFPSESIYVSGTSIAAPQVAAAMILLRDAFPQAHVDALEAALKTTAMDLGAAGPDNDSGYGLIDLMQSYQVLEQTLPVCTDADGDGYFSQAECGPVPDCNDNDPSIHPGAPEVKHDAIDQDCNGFDLTIDILGAVYTASSGQLNVAATSDLGKDAALELAGHGPMSWSRKKAVWSISVGNLAVDPGSVTVRGVEGDTTLATTVDTGSSGGGNGGGGKGKNK
ncbi:putative Subtilisin [Desulfosarcina cetonica]|nr:putative Subtilisin [Desulfosarcina cetonica]